MFLRLNPLIKTSSLFKGFNSTLKPLVLYDLLGLEWCDDSLSSLGLLSQSFGVFIGLPIAGKPNISGSNTRSVKFISSNKTFNLFIKVSYVTCIRGTATYFIWLDHA